VKLGIWKRFSEEDHLGANYGSSCSRFVEGEKSCFKNYPDETLTASAINFHCSDRLGPINLTWLNLLN